MNGVFLLLINTCNDNDFIHNYNGVRSPMIDGSSLGLRSKYGSLKPLIILGLLSVDSFAYAKDIDVSSFSVLEKSAKRLVLDGVGINYAFGATGVNLTTNVASSTDLTFSMGAGYARNQQISFAGATFTGPFTGYYLGVSTTSLLLTAGKNDFFVDADLSYKNFFSNSLVGTKGGSTFTGRVEGTMTSVGLSLVAAHRLNTQSSVYASYGLSEWSLETSGYGTSKDESLTASKYIYGLGVDPRWTIGYKWHGVDSELKVALSHQSLESRTNNSIVSVQASARFPF